jgi:hypothetical protein
MTVLPPIARGDPFPSAEGNPLIKGNQQNRLNPEPLIEPVSSEKALTSTGEWRILVPLV